MGAWFHNEPSSTAIAPGPRDPFSATRVPPARRPRRSAFAGNSARKLPLALGIGLLSLMLPAWASASFIVYRCGNNLCRVNPDGGGQSQLTSDGDSFPFSGYHSPSLSRDGTHLAFLLGGSIYTADADAQNRSSAIGGSAVEAHIAPDGSRVMGVLQSGDLVGNEQVVTWNLDGSGSTDEYYPTLAGGWAGIGEIGDSQDPYGNPLLNSLCLLTTAAPKQCARVVASDPTRDLFLPTLSPDGSTLAVELAAPGGGPSTIATFNYQTGALIRDVSAGKSDQFPTWSPDGKWLAFQRGTQIYKVPAAGGAAQLVVANGGEPTWGGPLDSTAPGGGAGGGGGAGAGGAGGGRSAARCRVPKLRGKTLAQAKRALSRSHCRLGKVRKARSRVAKGHVVSQRIAAGKTRSSATRVGLVLSRGRH